MILFQLREPVSAWSHGGWLLMALPGALMLWRRGIGDRGKQLVLLAYAACLAACACASMLYHAVPRSEERLLPFLIADHIGINALIAGTYTPIAWTLLHGRWRPGTLLLVWLTAGTGAVLQLHYGHLPCWLTTLIYLAMGWGALIAYMQIRRDVSPRTLRPILIGGACYSVGALLNLLGWPTLWPGVIGPHEVFHGFVIAGSAVHFAFIYRVVAPARPLPVGVPDEALVSGVGRR